MLVKSKRRCKLLCSQDNLRSIGIHLVWVWVYFITKSGGHCQLYYRILSRVLLSLPCYYLHYHCTNGALLSRVCVWLTFIIYSHGFMKMKSLIMYTKLFFCPLILLWKNIFLQNCDYPFCSDQSKSIKVERYEKRLSLGDLVIGPFHVYRYVYLKL